MIQWEEIQECPYYEVSNTGKIRRKKSGKILKEKIHPSGHCIVNLYFGGTCKPKTLKIHRLVAKAFNPNPNNFQVVDHIDRNKKNNNASNLIWTTQENNAQNITSTKSIRIKYISHIKKWSVDVLGNHWMFDDFESSINCLNDQIKYLPFIVEIKFKIKK